MYLTFLPHLSQFPPPRAFSPVIDTDIKSGAACCADSKGKWDELIEERGVRILIEPAALMHVIGTTMDFVEDRIKCVPNLIMSPIRHGAGKFAF